MLKLICVKGNSEVRKGLLSVNVELSPFYSFRNLSLSVLICTNVSMIFSMTIVKNYLYLTAFKKKPLTKFMNRTNPEIIFFS